MPTQGRTAEADTASEPVASPSLDDVTGFGAEFRELARQRRFIRSAEAAELPAAAAPAPVPAPDRPARVDASVEWRPASQTDPVAPPAPRHAAASTSRATASPAVQRMSSSDRAAISEIARMSEQLVAAREALAATMVRADRADADVAAAQQRMMAARALVQDAQRATRQSAERCAFLEGRCQTLEQALDLAVNASVFTRWRWRRQLREQTQS